MMTPVDIETADFKKVALGYSCDEVDTFLDKVIVEFERLFKENAKLQDKVTTTGEALKYYKDLEDTIRNSIVRAEKTVEETKHNAEVEASQIVKTAEQQAVDIMQDAHKQLYQLKNEIIRVRAEYESVKGKLKMLLETELKMLEQYEEELGLNEEQE